MTFGVFHVQEYREIHPVERVLDVMMIHPVESVLDVWILNKDNKIPTILESHHHLPSLHPFDPIFSSFLKFQ